MRDRTSGTAPMRQGRASSDEPTLARETRQLPEWLDRWFAGGRDVTALTALSMLPVAHGAFCRSPARRP